jgi:16S rRNA (uracil1498-N3)-methyltransferase
LVKIFVRESPSSSGLLHLDRNVKKRLIKVMRLHAGDGIAVYSDGKHYECRIEKILPDAIELRVVKELPKAFTTGLHVVIAQAIPKGDRFEWLIQKATELGAAEIFPLFTARTVVKPTNLPARLQRWNEIAEHAAGQSENIYPPVIHAAATLEEFLANKPSGMKLLLHERESAHDLRSAIELHSGEPITIAVGPEGGWTREETDDLVEAGYRKVHLGNRILRADTAGLALLAILQYELGELGNKSPAQKEAKT